MRAFVITTMGGPYSMRSAQRCIDSAARYGVAVQRHEAVDREHALSVMASEGLRWTWANGNASEATCPLTGLRQHPYKTRDLRARIGCAMSHYQLWKACARGTETYLILEHDAVFLRPLPPIEFEGICMINDPRGATPGGALWAATMERRGTVGVHPKTLVPGRVEAGTPDGLAGNSAYLLKPWAAVRLVQAFREYGVWPNDATMCIQLFPYLQELYPFVTRVVPGTSTTSS